MDPGLVQKFAQLRLRFTADNRACGVARGLFSSRSGPLEESLAILDQDGVVCIRAPRECGKTTLANSLANRLQTERGYTVSHEPFLVFTAASTRKQRETQLKVFRFTDARIGSALAALATSDLFILDDWPTANFGMKGQVGRNFFREVVHAHADGKRIVLLSHRSFDLATGAMNDFGIPKFFPRLQTVDLPFAFTPAQAMAYVDKELDGSGFAFSPVTLEDLFLFSGRFPLILKALCHALTGYWCDVIQYTKKPVAELPDGRILIDEDVRQFWDHEFRIHNDGINSLPRFRVSMLQGLSKKELSLIIGLMEKGPKDFAPIARAFAPDLEELLRLGIVFKSDDFYALSIPVLSFLNRYLANTRDLAKE
jgi:hypothetical protein